MVGRQRQSVLILQNEPSGHQAGRPVTGRTWRQTPHRLHLQLVFQRRTDQRGIQGRTLRGRYDDGFRQQPPRAAAELCQLDNRPAETCAGACPCPQLFDDRGLSRSGMASRKESDKEPPCPLCLRRTRDRTAAADPVVRRREIPDGHHDTGQRHRTVGNRQDAVHPLRRLLHGERGSRLRTPPQHTAHHRLPYGNHGARNALRPSLAGAVKTCA